MYEDFLSLDELAPLSLKFPRSTILAMRIKPEHPNTLHLQQNLTNCFYNLAPIYT